MLLPGTILQNRYRLLSELGHGGMGNVYEALDQRLKCRVALKETYASHDANARRAFEREAALLANLRHAALPKVIDYFTESDSDFLVMEFIPGYDLAELLDRNVNPFSESQVIGWALNTLGVLEYLHTQEPPIVHRDIKPANLKLTTTGELFLLDFGIAKGSLGAMSSLATSRSVRAFTPVYASLEQVLGLGTDARSDIYSLGATLYHLLTGTPPIDAPTRFQAIEDEHRDPLESMQALTPDISSNIAGVVYAAMGVSRKNRFSSAAAMRKALLAAVEPGDRNREEEQDGALARQAQVSETVMVPAVMTPQSESNYEVAPEIPTLRVPPPERVSFDFLPAEVSNESNKSVSEPDSDDQCDWYCSNCNRVINKSDDSCPHCGSETKEITDAPATMIPVSTEQFDQILNIGKSPASGARRAELSVDDKNIAFFDELAKIVPNVGWPYLNRGLAKYNKRDLEGAMADYNQAIEIDPKCVDAYINRALVWSSKRNNNAAIADCDTAIEIDPQNGRAYAVRGMAQYDKGDLNEAIIDLSKAIEINPKLAIAYASRGAAKLRQGEEGEADEDFQIARKLDTSMSESLEQWATDLKRSRNPGWAERLFRRVTGSRRLRH